MNMGNRIKELRLSKDLTQEELGNMVGVKKAAVQKWESGAVKNLKKTTIEKLSKIFNVLPSYLMCMDKPVEIDSSESEKLKCDNCSSLEDKLKVLDSLEFKAPEDAMKFILEQPVLMNFGGYDLENMSDEEIMALAEDLLLTMKIGIERLKKKKQ